MSIVCFLIPTFGIACERARRPDLAGKPLALTGDDAVLQVVSAEAEQYGIHAGQRASGARALCPAITLLPYDGESYLEAARGIWDLLAIESSVVEPVLPELCFAEIGGRDAAERVGALARDIARLVNAPTKAGLASSKIVARQAAIRALAEILTVESGREAAFLSDLPLDRLPNLDRALLRRLEKLGVRTLGDILRIKPHELHRQCRGVTSGPGHRLRLLAVGEDGDPVRPVWPPRVLEETLRFEVEIFEEALLCEALRDCAERLAPRLKAGSDYCRSLTLDISLEDGAEVRSEERLKAPTSDPEELLRVAVRLLQRLRLKQAALAVRLTAGGLGAGTGMQLILLDEHGNGFLRERCERLEAALGILRKRYGDRAVVRASMLRPKRRIDLWTTALTRTANEPVDVSLNAHGVPTHFWRRPLTPASPSRTTPPQPSPASARQPPDGQPGSFRSPESPALAGFVSEGHAAAGHTAKEFIPSHLPSHTVGHTAQEFIPSNLPSCGESIRQGAYRYDVEAVQDRWKEADWFGGKVVDKTVYRIVAGAGLYELHKIGAEWRLGAIAD